MTSIETSPPPNGDNVVYVDTALGSLLAGWESLEAAPSSTLRESQESGIIKCLNVKYADIFYRWAAPQIQTSTKLWDGTRDCTKFGPGCPQIKGPTVQVAGVPMFGLDSPFPHRAETEDEFQCLNLNIYAPGTKSGETATATLSKDLPVLVWVYGGAYQVGSASVDAYDGTELVRRSIEIGSPVVVVTVNYRVGVLGFLHSRQLVASTGSSTGNLGLLDCKCAFDWLRDNIQHFGGDPRQLAAVGESAGAGTIHHLMTVPQLYVDVSRVILSSSTCMSIQLQRAEEAQKAFDNICQKLGVDKTSFAVVGDLRTVPVDQLVESTWSMNAAFRPTWDDITIKADPREAAFRPELWNPALKSIIMGTCENEPWLRETVILANNKLHDFNRTISSRIPPVDDLRQRAAQIYADNDGDFFPWYEPDHELRVPTHNRRVMAFEGHCKYNTPGVFFAQSFLKSNPKIECTPTVYRYVFNYKTAHWPDRWPVTHTADILPMFLHKSLNDTDRRVAESFVDQLLEFTSGRPLSWRQYAADSHVLNVLGRDGAWSITDEAHETVFDLTEDHVQLWKDVLKAILATGISGWTEMGR